MERDRLAGLQLARALAALSIAYFHSWVAILRFPEGTAHPLPIFTGYGWIAVDLFFAISGFVICLVSTHSYFNIESFLIKRVFRLYPLWLLMLTLFALTVLAWRAPRETETLGYFLYSATLLPTEAFPFYDIGWSLQHEMLFYLVAAVIIPMFGVTGLAVFLATSTAIFHLFELPWYLSGPASYHAEFLAGVLAFIARPKIRWIGSLIPALIGIGLLYIFAALWGGRNFFPIALFFLVLAFTNMNFNENSRWMKPFVVLGDASYSIYLIHPLVFLVASAVVSKFVVRLPLWSEEPIRASCFAVIIVASILCWKFFESPMIRIGNRVAKVLINAPVKVRKRNVSH